MVLPQPERLKKSSEFNAVYNTRKSVANSLLILYTQKKTTVDDTLPKVAFVIGKKVHKKANKRNRFKRLMRESYRNIRKETDLPLTQWKRLIFLARPEILESNYKQVYDAVIDSLKKANRKYGNDISVNKIAD